MLFEPWIEINIKKKSPEYFSNTICKWITAKKFHIISHNLSRKKITKIVVRHHTTVFDDRQIKSRILDPHMFYLIYTIYYFE